MRPDKETALAMAEYQFKCKNERLMWQWLLEWASWEDDMHPHADRTYSQSTRNQILEEIAQMISKLPFGDTSASFAIYIRNMKT